MKIIDVETYVLLADNYDPSLNASKTTAYTTPILILSIIIH